MAREGLSKVVVRVDGGRGGHGGGRCSDMRGSAAWGRGSKVVVGVHGRLGTRARRDACGGAASQGRVGGACWEGACASSEGDGSARDALRLGRVDEPGTCGEGGGRAEDEEVGACKEAGASGFEAVAEAGNVEGG